MQTSADRRAHEVGAEGEAPSDDALRDRCYGLLANLLVAPPSHELLAALGKADVSSQDAAFPLGGASRVLTLAARTADPDGLDDEYHALFIGLGRGELVPYGSWYLTGFLMEKPLARLRADLAALGFERQGDVHEPEDHAAALCETMRMLLAEPDDTAGFEQQRQFFNDHIAPWMGQLFADMQQASSARFYRAVGQFGEQFIQLESHYFAMTA